MCGLIETTLMAHQIGKWLLYNIHTISKAGDADKGPCIRTSYSLDDQWATAVTLKK
jgi:hypothetical protein